MVPTEKRGGIPPADARWMHSRLERQQQRGGWLSSKLFKMLSSGMVLFVFFRAKNGYYYHRIKDTPVAISSTSSQAAARQSVGSSVDSSAGEQRDPHTRASTLEGQEEAYEGVDLVVVVMPSPPMVSGPMTRMDRLRAIRETWGDDLVDSAAGAGGVAAARGAHVGNNR